MEHFLSSWGYLALIVFTVAEAACIPIPSEVTLGFAGVLAATGHLNIVAVILLATAGETVGAFIGWSIGRFGGRPLIDRLGRYLLLAPSDLDRAEAWFDHRGEPAVLIGRMLPFIRTFISLPAGVAEMSPIRFGAFTMAGSLVFCTALGLTGYELGGSFDRITKGFSDAGYALGAIAVVAIAAFIAHRAIVYRHQSRAATDEANAPEG